MLNRLVGKIMFGRQIASAVRPEVAVAFAVALVAPRSGGNELGRIPKTHQPAEKHLELVTFLFVEGQAQAQLEQALLQRTHSDELSDFRAEKRH